MASEKLNVPEHVTIIMDGNGRWAKQRGQERLYGHKEGVESVRACTELAVEKGIKYLSVFAFSEENWDRPVEEIEGLMQLMLKAISMETPTFQKNGVRFRVIGDFSRLSQKLRDEIADCMKLTEHNTNLQLIIFLSYSGKWDIMQAANKFIADNASKMKDGEVPQMSAQDLAANLSTSGIPDPDLLIRTSGEQRISNYMLWQTAYTEYYFTEVLWPDFRKTEFQQALDAYSRRERRFGKV
ncbi:MAG: di-trans,poly-cis-decaprenylcistransferase [Bacteroidales bacterium]|nr:di-trans,poly-cis-decaprenylcistransferase [Bacteroidales bacterium]MBQ7018482.1 di-trans,poly-cis-decaprenylcistransferase [Bacteroidales bacterium]